MIVIEDIRRILINNGYSITKFKFNLLHTIIWKAYSNAIKNNLYLETEKLIINIPLIGRLVPDKARIDSSKYKLKGVSSENLPEIRKTLNKIIKVAYRDLNTIKLVFKGEEFSYSTKYPKIDLYYKVLLYLNKLAQAKKEKIINYKKKYIQNLNVYVIDFYSLKIVQRVSISDFIKQTGFNSSFVYDSVIKNIDLLNRLNSNLRLRAVGNYYLIPLINKDTITKLTVYTSNPIEGEVEHEGKIYRNKAELVRYLTAKTNKIPNLKIKNGRTV